MADPGISVRRSNLSQDGSRACPSTDDDPWMAAMRCGDFALAWRISDAHLSARRAASVPKHQGPRHLQHIWDGSPLAGKRVLVRCYHGLGDTVQFARFAAPLKRIAREVIVWVQAPLVPLIATAPGVDRVLMLHDGTPDSAYDHDIEIMELAHALRVDAQTIARPVPYLHPFSQPHERCAKPPGRYPIGLVWRAGTWAPERSLNAGLLAPLARVSGVRLLSLQCGPAGRDACDIPADDISCEDVIATAHTLRELDLLITVDTFIAHLAGALGVPTWLMLHADCDWRWMRDRTDSVWYPTMRLFRQPRTGDWTSVIEHIRQALENFVGSRGTRDEFSEQTIPPDVRLS